MAVLAVAAAFEGEEAEVQDMVPLRDVARAEEIYGREMVVVVVVVVRLDQSQGRDMVSFLVWD